MPIAKSAHLCSPAPRVPKRRRAGLLASAGVLALCASAGARAQEASDTQLQEVVVTAQKREQSLQEVPIAVTAIGAEALQANRITNVVDLSSLAPGLSVRVSAGGSGLPIFSVRGQLSYGLAPGSDKQTSIYLDGVYISSPRGSIFDLPDVQRIEVLRGPQGTLFGRNATTGAISISTGDPTGVFGGVASATLGDQDQKRLRLSLSSPDVGPFSGYFSYVHEERRGDIRNIAPFQVWDRTVSRIPRVRKIEDSVAWLGSKDLDSYFGALKFESGDFKAVYKFDRAKSWNTPEATSLLAVGGTGLLGNFLSALVTSNGVPIAPDTGKRPRGVYNSFAIPTDQTVEGHNLTSTWYASDKITVKNIFGYRKSFVFATSPIDGLSAVTYTPQANAAWATLSAFGFLAGQGVDVTNPANAALINGTISSFTSLFGTNIGQPYLGIASAAQNRSKQWSDELQVNYDSDFLTATLGAMWFHSKDYVAETWIKNTISLQPVPRGVFVQSDIGEYFNKATSIAAFAQAELHLTPQVDVVLGGRVTNDKKGGSFTFGATPAAVRTTSFDYNDTQFSYLVGVNYKPTDDILLYAKYSTAYVSGGSVAGIPFDVEKAKSAEGGIKAEFLNHRLRTNLVGWWSSTKHLQSPSSTTSFLNAINLLSPGNPAVPFVSVFVTDVGNRKAKGLEFEFEAVPARGLTVGGAAGYTDLKVSNVNPTLNIIHNGFFDGKAYIPKWTGSVYAQYETQPLFGDAHLFFRTDAAYVGSIHTDYDRTAVTFQRAPNAFTVNSYWTVNGRIALRDIKLGAAKGEVAIWGRNLFDTQRLSYALNLSGLFLGGNYIPARSFGIDLTVDF